jgi:hypothetical protein
MFAMISTDSFPYVLLCSTLGTVLSLAAAAIAYAPAGLVAQRGFPSVAWCATSTIASNLATVFDRINGSNIPH